MFPTGKTRGLDIFSLKILALIFMTLDHIYYFLSSLLPIPLIFTITGRLAAPIFIFALCEGFDHTRGRRTYMLRLYGFSVMMGALNLFLNAFLPHPAGVVAFGNIFATMFLILFFISFTEMIRTGAGKANLKGILGYVLVFALQAVILILAAGAFGSAAAGAAETVGTVGTAGATGTAGVAGVAEMAGSSAAAWALGLQKIISLAVTVFLPLPLTVEGSVVFVALGVVMYYTRKSPLALTIAYTAFSLLFFVSAASQGFTPDNMLTQNQWFMILALPFFLSYNGQRGGGLKYLFYLYYPLHITFLMALANFIGL